MDTENKALCTTNVMSPKLYQLCAAHGERRCKFSVQYGAVCDWPWLQAACGQTLLHMSCMQAGGPCDLAPRQVRHHSVQQTRCLPVNPCRFSIIVSAEKCKALTTVLNTVSALMSC